MKEPYALRKDDFDALLALFSPDREEAGEKYEKVRLGLVRYFGLKGCEHSEELADETLTRVAAKANGFDPSLAVKPTAYVYGFASNIFHEYLRHPSRREVELELVNHLPARFVSTDDGKEDADLDRLERCLDVFSAEDRALLIRYYSKEKSEKIKLRKQLAAELGCEMDALHMRVHRLRRTLKTCMDRRQDSEKGG